MNTLRRSSSLVRAGVALTVAAVLVSCTSEPPAPDASASATASDADSDADGGALPRVTAERRDFAFDLRLDGTTVAGAGVRLAPGSELRFVADEDDGTPVAAGDTVGRLEVPEELAAALGSETASPIDRARLEALAAAEREVTAPVAGTLQADEIVAPGVDVTVGLTPLQALRLASTTITADATVDTLSGRRSVTCAAVWTTSTTGSDLAEADDSADPGSGELRCRLPGHIATVPGLRASLEVRSEVLEDVVVVPTAFIGYDPELDRYTVWLDRDDEIEVVPVDVGLTDGVVQVVTSPLETGVPLRRPEPAT